MYCAYVAKIQYSKAARLRADQEGFHKFYQDNFQSTLSTNTDAKKFGDTLYKNNNNFASFFTGEINDITPDSRKPILAQVNATNSNGQYTTLYSDWQGKTGTPIAGWTTTEISAFSACTQQFMHTASQVSDYYACPKSPDGDSYSKAYCTADMTVEEKKT